MLRHYRCLLALPLLSALFLSSCGEGETTYPVRTFNMGERIELGRRHGLADGETVHARQLDFGYVNHGDTQFSYSPTVFPVPVTRQPELGSSGDFGRNRAMRSTNRKNTPGPNESSMTVSPVMMPKKLPAGAQQSSRPRTIM